MFGFGKKKNGFFAEIKEGATELQENVKEGVAELKENVKEGTSELQENVKEGTAELKENIKEGVADIKDSQNKKTKTKIEKSATEQINTQTKKTAPASEADRISELISSAVQGNNNNKNTKAESEDLVGFASKNFTLAPTPRRRPGANMTMFKEMASQAKIPRN